MVSEPVASYPDELVAAVTAEVMLALIAAPDSSPRVDEQSSRRLTAIDRDLRTRLLVACNAALKRSLEKAGAKIISKSRVASAAPIRERIRNVDAWRVPSVVGPLALQAALGLSGADLLDTEFADLKGQWDDWVATAQDACLRTAAKICGIPLATAYAKTSKRMTADRQAGWEQLQQSMQDRANSLMDDSGSGDQAPPTLNGDTLVLPQSVRAAMAIAGGYLSAGIVRRAITNSRAEDESDPMGGIGTGDTIADLITDMGGEVSQYQWLHGMSDRPLDGHLALDSSEFMDWDDPALTNDDTFPDTDFYYPGDHDGCFVGETLVSGPAPVSTFSRDYKGPIVEIVTRAGKQLTVTPNHPILTDRGWIAAGLLDEGDRLVCGSEVQPMAPRVPDNQQRPARIDYVVDSFPVGRSVITKAVVVAAEDFHGDGRYSEVGIIRADRLLAHEVNTEISEPIPQFDFGWAIRQAARLFTFGVGPLPFNLELPTAHGVAAATGAFSTPVGAALLEVGSSGRGRTATLDPGGNQSPFDDVAVYAVALGQSILRLAGQISLDDIAIKRVVEFHGQVYNLGTRVGWYLANGIVAHNCTCDGIVLWAAPGSADQGEGDIAASAGLTAAFNPDQPRDDQGRFASTGGESDDGGKRVPTLPGTTAPGDPNGNLAFNARLGRCYELSAEYAISNRGSVLVHGTIQGAGFTPLDHAWVETKDGKVFEPASGHLMSQGEFRDTFHPVEETTYSASKAANEMLSSGHYGPWGTTTDAGGPTGRFEQDAARVQARVDEELAAGHDTRSLYDMIDGKEDKYSAEREQLHQQIIDHFTQVPGIGSDRQMLVMAGVPGAGKTSFLTSAEGQQTVGVDLSQYVMVNADDVKVELSALGAVPSYPGLTAEEATGLVHEESSYLAKQVLAAALANGQNVAYDVTLSRASQFTEAVNLANTVGHDYNTTAVLVDTPVQTAVDRAISRYENGGRFVPPGYIQSMADPSNPGATKPVAAFNEIKTQVDKWAVVNNHGSSPVVSVGSNSPGVLVPA